MDQSEIALSEVMAAAAEPYLAAVVDQLVRDGVPATGYSMPADASPDDFDGEADGWINLPFEFTTRHYPEMTELGLWWNSVSGWRIHTQYERDNRPGDRRQWMGAGLLPPPSRVSAFLASMMVDYTMSGSPERPFYRRQGENVPALLERLQVYGQPAPRGRS
ncbi:DUF6292 family protein [Streptomyces sp. NPDC006879]|uniref:DUF6292 family protein n=1 Tax=Streptomyces sp. NPDC006879 TaxID=3364767 RepID=UPI00368B0680